MADLPDPTKLTEVGAAAVEIFAEYLEQTASKFAKHDKGTFWTREQLMTFLLREASRMHAIAAEARKQEGSSDG